MNICKFENLAPKLAATAFVHPQALLIGDVHLASNVSIWPFACVRADIHRIVIGQASNIQDGSILHVTHAGPYAKEGFALSIGQNVTVGHKAVLHGCSIGDRVLVGMGSVVLDGARIDNEVILGAGSLVPPHKHLASGYLYMGSPAKAIRPLTEQEKQFLDYSAEKYIELKNRYQAEL